MPGLGLVCDATVLFIYPQHILCICSGESHEILPLVNRDSEGGPLSDSANCWDGRISFIPFAFVYQMIPLGTFDDGVLVWFSARLFITFATVVNLYFILWRFGQRYRFQSPGKRAALQKQAWASFGSVLFPRDQCL